MNSPQAARVSNPERLAYWYFRLNGFLSIENFLIHDEVEADPRTDADLLAVRFANRQENYIAPMEDDPRVSDCATFANVIIAECKTSQCRLNGPWTNPTKKNMQRVLRAIGCLDISQIEIASTSLYRHGKWSNERSTVRLFALGSAHNDRLVIPREQQLQWDSVIEFCVTRFKQYDRPKSSIGQWEFDGRKLRELCLNDDRDAIKTLFNLV